jgi:hypothetical protein
VKQAAAAMHLRSHILAFELNCCRSQTKRRLGLDWLDWLDIMRRTYGIKDFVLESK